MCESFSVKNLAGIDRFQGSFIESSIQSEEEIIKPKFTMKRLPPWGEQVSED